ncbi:hypothetical protein R1sor_000185 [Riccia sorocarpa]|uniref:DUF4218 domain-containing protein n=1 Tax=Riccia sorocarpa TaxID=122646 RepID=A0ABD3GT78_9MARC
MRLVSDSPAVAHIEETWSEFARDPRHLRLGLASDGVSPYSIRSSTYSVWPMALMNYNIPPWLATKKGFILLALIVPGPKQTKNVDVFLQPLVEELSQLWEGVDDVFDNRTHRIGRDRRFVLKGILMWTMHDYPGLAPSPVSRPRAIVHVPLAHTCCHMIHHLLDPMHIEANVVKSLIKHLFGEKDNVRARRGCEKFNMHPESWMQVSDDGTETMPPAPWVLRKEERKTLCQRISKIRFPTGFGSYLKKAFTTDKASWPSDLKSHDFHILLQHVLPTCLHGLGTQELREAIYDLSRLMRWVSSKEINVSEVPRMDIFAAETLCKLKKTLQPSFFDSQIHLLVHLVREISICGHVHTRWMYWLERYMKVLKDDVRQRAKPEGSMAEGHLHREAMFFCSTILAQLDPGSPLLFREVEDGEDASFRLIGAGSKRSLSAMELDQIHVFILYNSELMEDWILRYEEDKHMTSDEPFCYPSFVEQCFYVECSDDVDWSFVIPYIPRERQFVGSDSSAAI